MIKLWELAILLSLPGSILMVAILDHFDSLHVLASILSVVIVMLIAPTLVALDNIRSRYFHWRDKRRAAKAER